MEGISDVSYAQNALTAACLTLGLQDDVKIVAVVNKWRWTLDLEQNPSYPDFGRSMIKLEKLLQERLHRPIDLRLEAEIDKNRRKQRNVLWAKTPSQLNSPKS